MLVLTRRPQERIYIGEAILTVLEIVGNKVRLGIEAPPSVPIHREEVLQRMAAEKLALPDPFLPLP